MKSLIYKELRECSLICLLALIALGAMMAGALSYFQPTTTPYSLPLLTSMFHIVTAFGYPALGLCLGFAQVIVDRRRGRWDFLIHRPMSSTRIFAVKAIVGSALYFLTAIIPLAVAAVWVATPGHVAAPFDWHMVLPRLADLFSGLVWYPAGMLIAARQARWIGSRIMPVGLALVASVLALTEAMNFTEALAIFVIAFAILFPATWAAFVFGGEYEPQPLTARSFQGVSLAPGLMLVTVVGIALAVEIIGFLGFDNRNDQKPNYQTYYAVDVNGQIVRWSYGPNGQQDLTDLNGRRLSAVEYHHGSTAYLPLVNLLRSEMRSRSERVEVMGFQNSECYARRLDDSSEYYWFYVANRQTIKGYDRWSRRYIGGIGPDGFTDTSSPPQSFPEPLQSAEGNLSSVLYDRKTVYFLHPQEPEISRIFINSTDDPILAAALIYAPLAPVSAVTSRRSPLIGNDMVAWTNGTIRVIRNARELFHIPLEHSFPPYTGVHVYPVTGGRYIFQYGGAYLAYNGSIPGDWIVESDDHGKILSRQQLPGQRQSTEIYEDSWLDRVSEVLAVPPVLLASVSLLSDDSSDKITSSVFIGLCAVALASALTNLFLLRQFKPRPRMKITWTLIPPLMGISGILLLLSLRQRIASVRCPSCRKPRLVSEELCPHCRAPFDSPPPLGIEIFELV